VHGGEVDAALIVQPEFALAKSCDWRLLREEPLVVLAPAALAGRDPLAILRREPFIRLGRETRGGRLADAWLRQERIQPRERLELSSLPAIAILVDRGVGVSLVPDWSPPWPEGLRLRRIALPRAKQRRNLGLVWNRSTPRAGPVRVLVNAAAEVCARGRAGSQGRLNSTA
jgi:DNA-binding transcriptional LysR family regulator